jgi:uncharacterized spore protein YtfJ
LWQIFDLDEQWYNLQKKKKTLTKLWNSIAQVHDHPKNKLNKKDKEKEKEKTKIEMNAVN